MTFRNFTSKESSSVYISWAHTYNVFQLLTYCLPYVSFPDGDYMCSSLLFFFWSTKFTDLFLRANFQFHRFFCYFLEIFLSSISLNFAFNVTFSHIISLSYLFYFLIIKENLKRNISFFLLRNLFCTVSLSIALNK